VQRRTGQRIGDKIFRNVLKSCPYKAFDVQPVIGFEPNANGKHRRSKALQRLSRAGKRRVVLAKLRFEPEMYTRLVANFDHAAQWLIESGSHSANYRIFGFVGKVGRVEIGEVAILDPIVERANG